VLIIVVFACWPTEGEAAISSLTLLIPFYVCGLVMIQILI
jgi:hypothetical protein